MEDPTEKHPKERQIEFRCNDCAVILRIVALAVAEQFANISCGVFEGPPSRTPLATAMNKKGRKDKHIGRYIFANLRKELTLPDKGILSRVMHKDEKVNVTLFGFAAGILLVQMKGQS